MNAIGSVANSILAIYRKELRAYFYSPLFYCLAGAFWLLAGVFFTGILLGPEGFVAEATFRDRAGFTDAPLDVPYEVLRSFLNILGTLSLFLMPMLSMGLYAEERKRGTLELLATSPITNGSVALGKLLAVVTFFIGLLMPVMVYEAIAYAPSDPPLAIRVILCAHLGLVLLAASILSLGMFFSSLTDSTLLAATFTFGFVLLLWIIDTLAKTIGGPAGLALEHLSLLRHYGQAIQGIFDTSSLILFSSYIVLGLFLTAQSVEALRFQRS